MFKPTIEVRGQKEIERSFKKLGPKIGKKPIRRGARAGAKIFAAKIKQNSPVLSGQLKKSVKVRAGKQRANFIQVLARTEFYGVFAEYGTVNSSGNIKQKEKPFMRPAYETEKRKANQVTVDTMADEINKEIKKI
jgi:HK97 gp10 family phage protein